jgi:hypothetical protein
MLGLFSRSRRPASPITRRFAKLHVEALEDRYCLSGGPVIAGLTAHTSANNVATFSGTVLGDSATYTLSLEGTPTANGYTYIVSTQDGSFLFSIQLQAGECGHVGITATDEWGQASEEAFCYVGPPAIRDLAASQGRGNVWTFTGYVTDPNPGGITITFEGLPSVQGMTVTTASDGTFFLQVTFQPGEIGLVGLIATDQNSLTSQEVFSVIG